VILGSRNDVCSVYRFLELPSTADIRIKITDGEEWMLGEVIM
jgi:hypothetical protein